MVGVAVKFTELPAQTVVLLADIETAGVTVAFTVIVMALLVAVALLTQDALLVNSSVITSLLTKLVVV